MHTIGEWDVEMISYNEFYKMMNIGGVIVIEDQAEFDFTRDAILYDFLQREEYERDKFINKIEIEEIKKKIQAINAEYIRIKDEIEWNKVPIRKIETYLEKKEGGGVLNKIYSLEENELTQIESYIKRYGFGIKEHSVRDHVAIIEGVRNSGLPIRIYTEYTAEELGYLKEDISDFTSDNKYVLCILDNHIGGDFKAQGIINDCLNERGFKTNGIGIVLTSHSGERIDIQGRYIEVITKGSDEVDVKIEESLIKSQYSIMLEQLMTKRQQIVRETFSYAQNNIEIAIYLANMAREEGITNYEVITQWLELKEKYNLVQNNLEHLKLMIALGSMLDQLEGSERINLTNEYLEERKDIQVFEKYDYNVNQLNLPLMSGDIFYIGDNYYMLVGQECDLSIRKNKRNNAIAELIPIKILTNDCLGSAKEKISYEQIVLSNFRKLDGTITNIAIDCSKRVLVDNEVLDICIFNSQGESLFDLNGSLEIYQKYTLPKNWIEYHEELKQRLNKLAQIKKVFMEKQDAIGVTIETVINTLGASHTGRLKSIMDFEEENSILNYKVQRVCRLKNHILLTNKLYLEYRGRQAFNTINMDIVLEKNYTLKLNDYSISISEKKVAIILTNKRTENEFDRFKRRIWIIKKDDLQELILRGIPDKEIEYIDLLPQNDKNILLAEGNQGIIGGKIQWTKISKNNELELRITIQK